MRIHTTCGVPAHAPLLLVEDSPEDREATLRAFRKASFRHDIVVCADGDDALDYLYRRGKYHASAAPALILLDLNMHGTDGREVLARVKADPKLRTIPVVVLTTSTNRRDIASSYHAGASSYVPKPLDMNEFVRTIEILKSWWFERIIPPPEPE